MYLFLLSRCVNRYGDLQLYNWIPEKMCKEDKGAKSFPLSSPEHVAGCPNPQGVHVTYPAALWDLMARLGGDCPGPAAPTYQLSPGKGAGSLLQRSVSSPVFRHHNIVIDPLPGIPGILH